MSPLRIISITIVLCLAAILLMKSSRTRLEAPAVTFLGLTNIPASKVIGGTSPNFPAWDLQAMGVVHLPASGKVALFMVSNSISQPIAWTYVGPSVRLASGWDDRGAGYYNTSILKPGDSIIFPVPEPDPEFPWKPRIRFARLQSQFQTLVNYPVFKLTNKRLFPVLVQEAKSPIVEQGKEFKEQRAEAKSP